jgi:glycosyltransferase involved in cell wall biosynthesis
VDDCSRDAGPAVVRSFDDPRITLIKQDHHGVSFTRNHGVDLATTDFIAFLDADDEWMPRHLETILRLLKKYPEAGMFATAYKIHTHDGKIQGGYKYIPDAPWEGLLPDYFRSCTLGNYPTISSNVVIPKKIFQEMGGFPINYWYGEDADLFGKIALKYPVAFSWECGAIYHTGALNRACDRDHPRNFEEPFVKTAREALQKGNVRPDLIESVNEFITRKELHRVYCNLDDENLENAESILNQCTTKLSAHEKKKLLAMIKLKLLMRKKLPSPVYYFLRNSRQNLMKMIRKK